MQNGYPFRPDPVSSPELYRDWLRRVSVPVAIGSSKTIPNPERNHEIGASNLAAVPGTVAAPLMPQGQAQDVWDPASDHWSGAILAGDPNGYNHYAIGAWTVPQIMGEEANAVDATSFWVGMDGYLNDYQTYVDLMQTGTEQISFWVPGIMNLVIYRAWVEYVPNQESVLAVTILPGMTVEVLASKLNSNGDASFGMWVWQSSGGGEVYVPTTVGRPSNTQFLGVSTEWIVEKPNYGSNHLSNFGTFTMTLMWYFNGSQQYPYAGGTRPGTLHLLNMANLWSGAYLSTPSKGADAQSMTWSFDGYQ